MNYSQYLQLESMGKAPHVLLCHGEEEYLLRDILKKLQNKGEDSFEFLEVMGNEFTVEDMYAFLDTFSLFSKEKILLVLQAESFSLSKEDIEYLGSQGERVFLYFKEKKGSYQSLSRSFQLLTLDRLQEQELKVWIKEQIENMGKAAKEAVLQAIIQRSGYLEYGSSVNLFELKTSLHKLTSTEEDLTPQKVFLAFPELLEDNMFQLQEEVGNRNYPKALQILYDYYAAGENLHGVLPMLSKYIYQLQVLHILNSQGFSFQQMKKEVGIHSDFIVRRHLSKAQNFTLYQLIDLQEEILEYERISRTEMVPISHHLESLLIKLGK